MYAIALKGYHLYSIRYICHQQRLLQFFDFLQLIPETNV